MHLQYSIAISWSTFYEFISGFNIHFPAWMTMDYLSAHNAHKQVVSMMAEGVDISTLSYSTLEAAEAWDKAPLIAGIRIIADIPALLIVMIITYIVFIGIRESRTVNNIMW
jgi:hypothetical protein